LKKDIESWRGCWIIINDRIFSTPNKENETLQLHPPSDFFPFFSLQIPAIFPLSSCLNFGAATMFFLASFEREQLALWKERK